MEWREPTLIQMSVPSRALRVAWNSYFPIEWLPDIPEALRGIPRRHPATWQRVLEAELSTHRNLDLHIFTVRSQYPRSLTFRNGSTTFHCLRVPPGMRTLSLFWWETILMRRELRRIRPHLLHSWGTERGAALVGSRLGYPSLVSMQGLIRWCLQHVDGNIFDKVDALLEGISLRRASVVTAESTFAVSWLRQHYPSLEVHQIEHAPNRLFHETVRRPQTHPLRFLYVGHLCKLKGVDLLISALAQLTEELDFRLTLVGTSDASFLAELKSAGTSQLWRRITIRQGLSSAEVAEEIANAAVMLFPTRVDNSPNSVKEAVVAGLPVVAASIGGIPDYVIPNQNGLLFQAGEVQSLILAIRTVVAHPLFSRGLVAPDCLARLRAYLSPASMAQKFLSCYQRVLQV